MEEEGGGDSSTAAATGRKRPRLAPIDGAGEATSKRARPPADKQEDDLDDLAFLLRIQQEQEKEEAAAVMAAPGGRRGVQVQAVLQRLRHPNDSDEEEEDGDSEEEGQGRTADEEEDDEAEAEAAEAAVEAAGPREPPPPNLFAALELWDFEGTQALLAADPEAVSLRDQSELHMPLAVAIAARFERGIKLLLSQRDPPCPLELVDGRGCSALHLAIEAHDDMPFLARFLLQYRGVDVNARAPLADDATPLHAVAAEDDKAVRLLLASGADPSLRDARGRTPLDVVAGTWPAGSRAKKRCRHWFTRRAPYQSYLLHKLRLLARWAGAETAEEEDDDDAFVAGLARTALQKLMDERLEVQGKGMELVHREGDREGEGDEAIMCRLETTGVFSFVSSTGRLCLARVDRSVSPLLVAAPSGSSDAGHVGAASAAAPSAAPSASAVSSATTSPANSPLIATTPEPLAPVAAAATPVAPLSPVCCPLSQLKGAAIFDLGEADEEEILSRQGSSVSRDDGVGTEPWVLLPPLPRVQLLGGGDGVEADLPAAVLRHVVLELRDEAMFDALQAMLWR